MSAMPNDTELHRAANQGEFDEVESLLQAGMEIDARGAQGRTALHRALGAGETATAKLLIEHKADPGVVDLQMRTSLHWAALAPCAPGKRMPSPCRRRSPRRLAVCGALPPTTKRRGPRGAAAHTHTWVGGRRK